RGLADLLKESLLWSGPVHRQAAPLALVVDAAQPVLLDVYGLTASRDRADRLAHVGPLIRFVHAPGELPLTRGSLLLRVYRTAALACGDSPQDVGLGVGASQVEINPAGVLAQLPDGPRLVRRGAALLDLAGRGSHGEVADKRRVGIEPGARNALDLAVAVVSPHELAGSGHGE